MSLAVIALAAFGSSFERQAAAQDQKSASARALPVFEVDPNFPTMPDHMLLGGVGGATADSHGNVWVFHRPHTLEEDNATLNGYAPAPPVLAFSPTGRYLGGWGGPSKSGPYEWFNRGGLYSAFAECQSCKSERRRNGDGRPGSGEHGIAVDAARQCLADRQRRRRRTDPEIHQGRQVPAADRQGRRLAPTATTPRT